MTEENFIMPIFIMPNLLALVCQKGIIDLLNEKEFGEAFIPAAISAIIDKDTFDEAQQRLAKIKKLWQLKWVWLPLPFR